MENRNRFSKIARWWSLRKLPTVLFGALASLPRSGRLRCSSRVSDLALLQACVFRARGLQLYIAGRNMPVRQKTMSGVYSVPAYNSTMNGITIYVDWAYFLGIVGTLIGIAYYANGRFTKIETTVDWLKETLLEIKTRLEQGTGQHEGDLSSRVSPLRGSAKRHSRR
jgi:hypothetical protein